MPCESDELCAAEIGGSYHCKQVKRVADAAALSTGETTNSTAGAAKSERSWVSVFVNHRGIYRYVYLLYDCLSTCGGLRAPIVGAAADVATSGANDAGWHTVVAAVIAAVISSCCCWW